MSSFLTLTSSRVTLVPIIFVLCFSPLSFTSATTGNVTSPFKRIYAFGDSYTDTGNTRSATGPNGFRFVSNPPYGRTFFHHPTNRYSDGRLLIDFLAQSLSLPFLPPYLDAHADKSHGVNFAVAGATAIRHAFFVRNNLTLDITPQSIETQMMWFSKLLESQGCQGNSTNRECDAILNDALIWVGEIGVNDYAYTIGSTVSADTIQRLALKSVSGFLQALLSKGAKYVVVQGHPPTGCLPLAMALAPEDDRDDIGCVGSANKRNFDYNALLQAQLHGLRVRFPHSVIVYADYFNAYRTIVKNISKYGFKEAFKACCGTGGGPYNFDVFAACGSPNVTSCTNPAEYINWDGVHLTESMYKVVHDMYLRGGYTHPPFDYLLSRKQQQG